MTHENDTLFMTHGIEPLFKNHFSIWLKVLNSSNNSKNSTLFLNTTQRVAPFFFEYDAKNWTLFLIDAKNWTLYEHDSKELNLFLTMIQRIESLSEYDSKNRTFFLNTTQWIEPIFLNVTQKIEILVEKIVKKFKMVFYMTRRIGPAFFNMTQRIEPFSIWLKDLIYSVWPQELNFFLTRTDRIGPFFLNMT